MNYEEAREIMKAHRANVAGKPGVMSKIDVGRKRLGHKTYLTSSLNAVHAASDYTLSLFKNDIITFAPTTVTINDQGWFSRTTFGRLNQYLPKGFSVRGERTKYGKKVIAFVITPDGSHPYDMPVIF